ncbi:phage protein Gp36 family protein [Phocaeicola faecicola]|uniref:phage protein Gp36 family protein n=1 Tax=Phocaeicola faecicola TaxID=2739389 RepID=UPI002A820EDC|nr:phage protein Gp36 family protein [Phocaeicola faecicola]MDY4872615.1 phage protein Gp36 family protein [Phocaeicola faecicola]
MNNFITVNDYDATIHREILDSLLREDAGSSATIEVCENRAIATVRALISSRYDCDAIFSATGDQRNVIILKVCIDIAVYEIFCQHNPYKMSQIGRDRYEDAMQFLREVRDHQANIDGAPLLPVDTQKDNSPWQIESNELRATHF